MNSSHQKSILCPQCKKQTVYSAENKFRPFCSERCRLIDLGAWADESYKVPDKENMPSNPAMDDDFETDPETRH